MSKPEILIIDDEPQIRRLLEITLQSNSYLVKQAGSGKDGLIMAANHPPELILLDLGLPDESWHLVLQKLRQWYTNPIIILSVQKGEDDIIKALDNSMINCSLSISVRNLLPCKLSVAPTIVAIGVLSSWDKELSIVL